MKVRVVKAFVFVPEEKEKTLDAYRSSGSPIRSWTSVGHDRRRQYPTGRVSWRRNPTNNWMQKMIRGIAYTKKSKK